MDRQKWGGDEETIGGMVIFLEDCSNIYSISLIVMVFIFKTLYLQRHVFN